MDAETINAFERRAYALSEAGAYERDYDARQGAAAQAEAAKRVEGYLSGLGLGDTVPTPEEYDYAAMLSEGVVPKADPSGRVPLPPQYWKPGHLVVRGIDLATGQRVSGGPSLEDMLLGAADDGEALMDAELTPADLDELPIPARNSLEAWMQTRGMAVVAGPAAGKPASKDAKAKPQPSGVGAGDVGLAMMDMLAGALKGSVAQTLGLPGDLESLVRMLTGGEQVLPTTEQVSAALPPVVPDGDPQRKHTADTFETLGQFAPLPGVPVAKGAAAGAKALAPVAAEMAENAMRKGGLILDAAPPGAASRTISDIRASWKSKGVTLDAYESQSRPELITLSKIEVPKESRGQGAGSEAMTDLVQYADENSKTIALSPSTDFGGSSKGRLVDFYKRFGFVENKGRNKDFTISETMYRLPRGGDQAGGTGGGNP